MTVEPNEFQKALELLDAASLFLACRISSSSSPRKEIIAFLSKYPIDNIKAEPIDKNVEGVREQLKKRAEHGLAKYGVTTERKDVDLLGWLQHLQEELMDASVYIERLKSEVPKPATEAPKIAYCTVRAKDVSGNVIHEQKKTTIGNAAEWLALYSKQRDVHSVECVPCVND